MKKERRRIVRQQARLRPAAPPSGSLEIRPVRHYNETGIDSETKKAVTDDRKPAERIVLREAMSAAV